MSTKLLGGQDAFGKNTALHYLSSQLNIQSNDNNILLPKLDDKRVIYPMVPLKVHRMSKVLT